MRMTDNRQSGFTLLEVTVVIGLLAGFLVFLTQLLAGGVELYDEGESGQELADIGNAAASAAVACVEDLVGPEKPAFDAGPPDARLLVQWIPLGMAAEGDEATRVQVLRSTVRVREDQETALLERSLRAESAAMGEEPDDELIAAQRAEQLAGMTRRGRAEMLLMPWPAGDEEGAFLELRRGLWLIGERIPIDRRKDVALMEIERLEDRTLRPERFPELTELVATGLLHLEFQLWSQYTKSFDRAAGETGPEWVWDSARAGWLSESEEARERFSLDLSEESLEKGIDDVFPRAVRITLVVAREGREAILARELSTGDTSMGLVTADPLLPLDGDYLKVGSEWVRYRGSSGDEVTGLERGARGTRPVLHPRGTRVRVGKTIRIVVRLPHGRDNWNG